MQAIIQCDRNRGIGKGNGILFSLPKDRETFLSKTKGKVVVTTVNTLSGYPGRIPSEDRKIIVYGSRGNGIRASKYGYTAVSCITELLDKIGGYPADDVFVIGGPMLYRHLLPYCDKAYVTWVEADGETDTFLENLDNPDNWHRLLESGVQEDNGYDTKVILFGNGKVLIPERNECKMATLNRKLKENILKLHDEGHSRPEIARRLGLHINTVHRHLKDSRYRFIKPAGDRNTDGPEETDEASRDVIRQAFCPGDSMNEIARKTGFSNEYVIRLFKKYDLYGEFGIDEQYVRRNLKKASLKAAAARRAMSEERCRKVLELEETGMTYREIARQTGFSETSVRKYLQSAGRKAIARRCDTRRNYIERILKFLTETTDPVSVRRIADMTGICRKSVSRIMKEENLMEKAGRKY